MNEERRRFLRFLAATPALPFLDLPRVWMEAIYAFHPAQTAASATQPGVIATAADAFSKIDRLEGKAPVLTLPRDE